MFRLTESLDSETFKTIYQTSDGTTACRLSIYHKEKKIDVSVNAELLNYKNSLALIAHSIGILPSFLTNDNIIIKNYYGFTVSIKHEKM